VGGTGCWETFEEECEGNDGGWWIGNEVEGVIELLEEVVVLISEERRGHSSGRGIGEG